MAADEFQKLDTVGSVPAGRGEISVFLFRYGDDGETRIKVQRTGTRKDGSAYFSDVSSLNAEEAAAVAPLLVKAAKKIKG